MKEGVTPKIPNEPARRASRRSPVSSDEDGHCAKQSQIGLCNYEKTKRTQFFYRLLSLDSGLFVQNKPKSVQSAKSVVSSIYTKQTQMSAFSIKI
jgi:hypothetical protein